MNNKSKRFSLVDRLKSFGYAINGLKILFKEEHNARIHIVIVLIVVILGLVFGIAVYEWLTICILIALVLSLEALNSAVENLSDYVSPQWNERIKKAKDLSAAAVFIAALISVVCGCIIFLPKMYERLVA